MNDGSVPVGDTEVLAYMYPRTMESPMSEQWLRIYMYVFNKAMAMKKVEVPEDLKSETLSNYDLQQLNDLKRFIYAKRVQHRKEKARTMKQETKEAKELEIKSAQPSFF
jgi:hypothetical protein